MRALDPRISRQHDQPMRVFKLLLSIDGRIDRATYVAIMLGAILYAMIAAIAIYHYADSFGPDTAESGTVWFRGNQIASIPAFWVLYAAQVKRLHDFDKSGWWMLVALIPVIGTLWHLFECCFRAGTPGPNRYDDKTWESQTVIRGNRPW
jgi:uncharacterized membrane protein YhaH (DUF805 family)